MNVLNLDHLAARLCSASYSEQTHRLQNMLKWYTHINGSEHGCDVVIGEGLYHNFVIFRGTEVCENVGMADLRTDLKFCLNTVPNNPYQLHRGFFDAWCEVAESVGTEVLQMRMEQLWDERHGISNAKPWVFTGHSLGGAMATIAAATMKPAHLVTFGAPRVGGSEFVQHMETNGPLEWRRWVHAGDWCPRLPPPWFGHRHGGELNYITRDGMLLLDPPKAYLTLEFITDAFTRWKRHGIDQYVDCVEELAREYHYVELGTSFSQWADRNNA